MSVHQTPYHKGSLLEAQLQCSECKFPFVLVSELMNHRHKIWRIMFIFICHLEMPNQSPSMRFRWFMLSMYSNYINMHLHYKRFIVPTNRLLCQKGLSRYIIFWYAQYIKMSMKTFGATIYIDSVTSSHLCDRGGVSAEGGRWQVKGRQEPTALSSFLWQRTSPNGLGFLFTIISSGVGIF